MDKHKAAACAQPGTEDNQNKHENNQQNNASNKNRMRDLADRIIYLLHPVVLGWIVKVASRTGTQTRKPRGETDNEPFFQVERLEQDLLHQLECFTKRFEDLDMWLGSIHARHSERVSRI
jgi:hypothetical protein